MEQERKKAKLWFPTLKVFFFFWYDQWSGLQDMDRDDDEDPGICSRCTFRNRLLTTRFPDIVQLMDPAVENDSDLGQTRRRDPDALPPSNLFELVMLWLYQAGASLGGGNVVFAIKAGLLTGK